MYTNTHTHTSIHKYKLNQKPTNIFINKSKHTHQEKEKKTIEYKIFMISIDPGLIYSIYLTWYAFASTTDPIALISFSL